MTSLGGVIVVVVAMLASPGLFAVPKMKQENPLFGNNKNKDVCTSVHKQKTGWYDNPEVVAI